MHSLYIFLNDTFRGKQVYDEKIWIQTVFEMVWFSRTYWLVKSFDGKLSDANLLHTKAGLTPISFAIALRLLPIPCSRLTSARSI